MVTRITIAPIRRPTVVNVVVLMGRATVAGNARRDDDRSSVGRFSERQRQRPAHQSMAALSWSNGLRQWCYIRHTFTRIELEFIITSHSAMGKNWTRKAVLPKTLSQSSRARLHAGQIL
jgi:hypothetical protein